MTGFPSLYASQETAPLNNDALTAVIPAQAGIQYAEAYRFYHFCLWNTGSPAFAGDDAEVSNSHPTP